MPTAQSGQDLEVETWTPNSLSCLGTIAKRKISSDSIYLPLGNTKQNKKINSQNVKRNQLETSDAKHKGKLKTHTLKAFE